MTASVTMWFKRHLGTGMGLLQSAQGVGPLVAVPIMLLVIALFGGGLPGLRAAFWVPGIIGGLAILALVRLFYDEPGQIGMRPLGAAENEPVRKMQVGEIAKIRTKVFFKQAQRTLAFWNLIGIHFWVVPDTPSCWCTWWLSPKPRGCHRGWQREPLSLCR